ncbi:hypothetical protein JK162_10235 [Leuconostoc pseudomesenteroides]|uniref:hypothetical protein n=1 Tax=Leuconostoc pseudomesenteroides TaxID=33968 RepID=UPI001B8AED92|nr:hypothetical protein [Leuconostoc pseudomesenteroides]MBS0958843.1 hypothetical protein [Leuconostoc pseudomesenteroides]
MAENKNVFKIAFKGKRAEEVNEAFSAYFWDGGLDQHIESDFLERFDLDLDDVHFDENANSVVVDTNGHKDDD